MLLQRSQEEAIYQRAMRTLQETVKTFGQNLKRNFQVSFEELSSLYQHQKTQNTSQVNRIKTFIDNYEQKLEAELINFPLKQQPQDHPSLSHEINEKDQSLESIQQEGIQKIGENQDSDSNPDQSNQPAPNHQKEDSQEEVNKKDLELPSQQQESSWSFSEIQPGTKYPLLTSKDHRIMDYSMTPNITTIQLKLLQYDNLKTFTELQFQTLSKYDLTQIQSIDLNNQSFNNSMLRQLTSLQWTNIISLDLGYNFITDITPLKNFNLRHFTDLDVSLNPLNQKSAEFLASSPFDQMIYFSVSFETKINKKYWKILLQGKMSNFPKLENIEIRESQELKQEIRNEIQETIKELERKQKNKAADYYPPEYSIKVSFEFSKKYYARCSLKDVTRIYNLWKKNLKVTEKRIKPESIKDLKKKMKKRLIRQMKRKGQENEAKVGTNQLQKTKPIKKFYPQVKTSDLRHNGSIQSVWKEQYGQI